MKKIITITLAIILGVGGIVSAFLYSPLVTLDSNKIITQDSKFIDDITQINNQELKPQIEKNKQYKVVAFNDNWKRPLNPIYSLIYGEFTYNNQEKSKGVRVAVYELKRENLFATSYELPQLPKYNAVSDLDFDKVASLAQAHDLTTNFPNKETYKITNYPPLTPTEIENNRKVRENSELVKQKSLENQKKDEIFNSLPKEDKIKQLKDEVQIHENTIKCYDTYLNTISERLGKIAEDKAQQEETVKLLSQYTELREGGGLECTNPNKSTMLVNENIYNSAQAKLALTLEKLEKLKVE